MTGDNLQFAASQIVAPQHASGDTYTNLIGPGEGATTRSTWSKTAIPS